MATQAIMASIWEVRIYYVNDDEFYDSRTGFSINHNQILTCCHGITDVPNIIKVHGIDDDVNFDGHLVEVTHKRPNLDLLLLQFTEPRFKCKHYLKFSKNEILMIGDLLFMVHLDNKDLRTESFLNVVRPSEVVNPQSFTSRNNLNPNDLLPPNRGYFVASDLPNYGNLIFHPNLPLIRYGPNGYNPGRSGAPVMRLNGRVVGVHITGCITGPLGAVHLSVVNQFLREAAEQRIDKLFNLLNPRKRSGFSRFARCRDACVKRRVSI